MFVNRIKEKERLSRALAKDKASLIIVYGRRRCGKSTLIKHILTTKDVYFVADLREKSLQIDALAKTIDNKIAGFAGLHYPNWESLFTNLNNRLENRITLCIDEFPYLVKHSPELPSLLQNVIDNNKNSNYNIILCGSSQQMMHGIALNSSSPLFGRSEEILNIKPMLPGWYSEYFGTNPLNTVEGFGIWGGIPRYWEIQKSFPDLHSSVKYNLLEKDSMLLKEPELLFSDEMRTSVLAYSILSLIGMGCNRLSEIASRIEKPAIQLNRPLNLLIDLGYVRREIPFGANPSSSKKSLYKISDPFMSFYFTFIVNNRSRIEYGLTEQVWTDIHGRLDQYFSGIWEDMCRLAVPLIKIDHLNFLPASRWWGRDLNNNQAELDLVAEDTTKEFLLIGEVKWNENTPVKKTISELKEKTKHLSFTSHKKVIHALFLKKKPPTASNDIYIFTPEDIIGVLK